MEGIDLNEPVVDPMTHLSAKFSSKEDAEQFIEANHPGGKLKIVPIRR